MFRWRRLSFWLVLVLILVVGAQSRRQDEPRAAEDQSAPSPAWADDFSHEELDPDQWAVTSAADFRENIVEVLDGRLRLQVDTIGTDDETVKYLGVRSVGPIRFAAETRITAELDWNDQANGSYLRAGLVLSPLATSGNPQEGSDWLKVEYVGVPPGKNARILVARQAGGRVRHLYNEGWPQTNRGGRQIGRQDITLVIREASFEVLENGALIFESGPGELPFASAYLYLQMSSHSNYRAREVFFDDVSVTSAP